MQPSSWRYTLRLRLRSLFRRDVVERELSDELLFHIDRQIETNLARGMTPDEARTAALRAFGGIDQRKEECRDARSVRVIEDFVGDVRYALRMMRRAPGFTAVAVLSLALGLGANTAIFSLLDAVLLKSLPVHDADRLVSLRGPGTYPVYQAVRQHDALFAGVFATTIHSLNVEIGNALPERTSVSLVSGTYFSVLGVPAFAGRTLSDADDRIPGAHPVAVASYAYWQRRFGRDPRLIGSTLRITSTPVTIIGVTPPGFFGERVGAAPDLWVPLTMWGQIVPGRNLLQSPGTAWLSLIGRLQPGVTAAQTQAALTPVVRQVLRDTFGPNAAEDDRRDIERATVTAVRANRGLSSLRAQVARPLQILMAVVALVLLIACANVANLLLVRAAARRREIAVRLAIGMGRGRLIRQLATESLVLSGTGGLVGLALAWWVREVLLRLVSTDGTRVPLSAGIDMRVLLFAAALSLATGLLFGLVPARQTMRVDLVTSVGRLRHAEPAGTSRFALSSALVVGQVALSLVLLAGAGLFLRTVANLRDVNLGFHPERLLMVDIDRSAAYRGPEYAALCRRLLQRMRTVAGVESVTMSENGTLTDRDLGTNRMRPADFIEGSEGIPRSRYDVVGPDYFATMGIARVAGRDIDERDEAAAPRVVAINDAMARRFFGTGDVLGRRMLWGVGKSQQEMEVIAVVRDVKQRSPRDDAELRFYVPYFQHPARELASARFIVRTAAAPEAVLDRVQQTIRSEDRRLSIGSIDLVTDLVDRTLARERMIAALSSAFGMLAVVLACVGLYGLMAHRVVRRTSEIGIRMAFGAGRRSVLWMIVRQDLALVGVGILMGVPLALAASGLTRSVLFGIDAHDRATLSAAVVVIALAGVFAGLAPAWRAMRIDPAAALRHE